MTSDSEHQDSSVRDDAVERLIRVAGKRAVPPADLHERTFEIATDALHRKVRRRRWRAFGVAAAAVVFALSLAWQLRSPPEIAAPIASIERIIGPVSVQRDDSRWTLVDSSVRALERGASIRTESTSRAALSTGGSYSIRLAGATELRLLTDSRLQLIAGKVYVASTAEQGSGIVIVTPEGEVSDIGTQFEVQVQPQRLRVRVRQGTIAIVRATGQLRGAAGEELTVSADGSVKRSAIAPDDAAWQWAEALAPTISIDGEPLAALLQWVERETGRRIRFANADVEQRVSSTILHGDIGSLAPLDALTVMLSTTDFRHRILEDGTIVIEPK